MNVVSLGTCRELLELVAAMRQQILSGNVQGLALCMTDLSGKETAVIAGSYRTDHAAGLSASLRLSWEMTNPSDLDAQRIESSR